MAQFRYASPYSVKLPELNGQVILYIRKADQFSLNRWITYVPCPSMYGAYQLFETDQQVRIYDDATTAWYDGSSRKQMGQNNRLSFVDVPFKLNRRNIAAVLGWQTEELADPTLHIKQATIDAEISQLMTDRALRLITLCENASNWTLDGTTGVVSTANTLNNGAGKFSTASDDPQSANYNAIYKCLSNAAEQIALATNNVIKPDKLRVVFSPTAARLTGASAEISNYCRQSPFSKDLELNGWDKQYDRWGLPTHYRGFELVVEDSCRVAQNPQESGQQATTNRAFIKPDSTIYMVAQPAVDGEYGTRPWSTVQMFHYGPLMALESFNDPEDRLSRIHVSESTLEVLTAPNSGALISGVI